jgi:hypothetical protein
MHGDQPDYDAPGEVAGRDVNAVGEVLRKVVYSGSAECLKAIPQVTKVDQHGQPPKWFLSQHFTRSTGQHEEREVEQILAA